MTTAAPPSAHSNQKISAHQRSSAAKISPLHPTKTPIVATRSTLCVECAPGRSASLLTRSQPAKNTPPRPSHNAKINVHLRSSAAKISLPLILITYLLLTGTYSIINPLFEAPDEHHHFFTTLYIAQNRRLPQVTQPADPFMGQEAAQPPLYYLLGSLLIAPIDTSAARDALWLNPFVRLGDASAPTNINQFVHTPQEQWPWGEWVLAAHLLRFFSVLIGMGTLLYIYAAARRLWPQHPIRALIAVAVTAFLPQFNFLHSYINNDVLVIFFSSAILFQLITLWKNTVAHGDNLPIPVDKRRLLWISLLIGCAILSKTAGLLVSIYAATFVFVLYFSPPVHNSKNLWKTNARTAISTGRRNLKPVFIALIYLTLPAMLIGLPLLWRNWQLYGDISAANQFIAEAGGDRGYTLWQVIAESGGIWRSFIAVFGWFNVRPPQFVYLFWIVLGVIAKLGSHKLRIVRRGRAKSRALPWLIGFWLLVVYAGMLTFMLQTKAAQGRLLMPALLPITLGVAYGLSGWIRRLRSVAVLTAATAVVSLASLVLGIAPAYRLPPPVSAETLISVAAPPNSLTPAITLLGTTLWTTDAQPGDIVWMTLNWQAAERMTEPPEVVITILGRDPSHNNTPTTLIAKLQSYHGGGLYPANLWKTGETIHSRIGLRLNHQIDTPTLGRVNVGIVGGEAVDIGFVKVTPADWPIVKAEPLAHIADGIEIVSAETDQTTVTAGERLKVTIHWQTTAPPDKFLTTFIHLGELGQAPIAQGDAVPLGGSYPTDWWGAGENFVDNYWITIPHTVQAGDYALQIGMYDTDLIRQPLIVDGEAQPFEALQLGTITVIAPDSVEK